MSKILVEDDPDHGYRTNDVKMLNRHFVDYVNFGGYPEAVSSPVIRSDPARYIGADIVDRVLLRDLPSLYGIQDVQELNTLFTDLGVQHSRRGFTGSAVSAVRRDQADAQYATWSTWKRRSSSRSSIASITMPAVSSAPPVSRCMPTTPSLRCALFGPVAEDDGEMGPIAETAVFAQWFHSDSHRQLHYASWRNGEVDIVCLDRRRQKPTWCVEVKWSDRYVRRPGEPSSLMDFANRHPEVTPLVTTRTLDRKFDPRPGNAHWDFIPTSLYCYIVGREAVRGPLADTAWLFGG